jgi:hypothetical protein
MTVTNRFSYISANRSIAMNASKLFFVAVIFTALALAFFGCSSGGNESDTNSISDVSSSSSVLEEAISSSSGGAVDIGDPMPDKPHLLAGRWSSKEPLLTGVYSGDGSLLTWASGMSVRFTDETGGSGKVTVIFFAENRLEHQDVVLYDNLPYTIKSEGVIEIGGMDAFLTNGTGIHAIEYTASNDSLILSRFLPDFSPSLSSHYDPNDTDWSPFFFIDVRLENCNKNCVGCIKPGDACYLPPIEITESWPTH